MDFTRAYSNDCQRVRDGYRDDGRRREGEGTQAEEAQAGRCPGFVTHLIQLCCAFTRVLRVREKSRSQRHMSDLERLLVPGCTELPACRCGKEMHLDHTLPLPTDTHIRVYRCLTCHCEMRLTVWGTDPLDQLNTLVIEPAGDKCRDISSRSTRRSATKWGRRAQEFLQSG